MTVLKSALAVGLLAFGPAAAEPAAKPPTPVVITNPDWISKPNGEDFSEHYPRLASQLGMDGYALLSCLVNSQGLLVDCRSISESPQDLGFGKAVIAMSGQFRMKPATRDGRPVDGGTVRIPIRFAMPRDRPAAPPAPVSESAARQAERLVDSLHGVEGALAGWEKSTTKVEVEGDDQTSTATRAAAADAMRRAGQAHREDLRTAYASAFAAVFSEDEMAALTEFAKGPGGAALQDNDGLRDSLALITAEYWREASAGAHAAFCAKHACDAARDVSAVWRAGDPREAGRIDNPQWAEQPGEATVSAARPPVAGLLGFSGLVRLTCRVSAAGAPDRCQVDEEAPGGFGYGAAALALAFAGGYRLSSIQLADGGAGKKVTIRVGFPAPLLPTAYAAPAGTQSARALARQIAGDEQTAAITRRDTELQLANYASRPPPGGDRKVYDAALDAFRAGSEAALARYIEQSINVWSTSFTEVQLAALAAFRASPAGKAKEERREELNIATDRALAYAYDKITADARAEFCKARNCSAQPSPQSAAVSSEPSARKP